MLFYTPLRTSPSELSSKKDQSFSHATHPDSVTVRGSPPPPPLPLQQKATAVKTGTRNAAVKMRSKFEPELDPREELMIAIRSFSKRNLKSVSCCKINILVAHFTCT